MLSDLAIDVAQEVGEHLEEVGLTGAEEARDPYAVGVRVVRISLQHLLDTLSDLVSEDVFLDLDAELGGVISLDDAFD
jgi:hypothetical protein